jgi:hypothetical protein
MCSAAACALTPLGANVKLARGTAASMNECRVPLTFGRLSMARPETRVEEYTEILLGYATRSAQEMRWKSIPAKQGSSTLLISSIWIRSD